MKSMRSQILAAPVRRQQLWIDAAGLAGCIAILAAGYFLGVAPLLHHKTELVARNRALAAQRQKVQAAERNVRQLKSELAGLQKVQAQDVIGWSKPVRINTRLEQITSMAAAQGLEIKGVEPGSLRQEPHYQVTPLRLSGTGSFRGCLSFLHDLRQSMHDTTVAAFRLSGTPEAAGVPVSFNLDLLWYTAPQVATAQDQ